MMPELDRSGVNFKNVTKLGGWQNWTAEEVVVQSGGRGGWGQHATEKGIRCGNVWGST